jgi:hypothetical protein
MNSARHRNGSEQGSRGCVCVENGTEREWTDGNEGFGIPLYSSTVPRIGTDMMKYIPYYMYLRYSTVELS